MQKKPSAPAPVIMVCVTRQKTCARLIARGAELAKQQQTDALHVVHAVRVGDNFLNNPFQGEALEYLFEQAQSCNAELSVLRANDVVDALVDHAKTNRVTCIVIGAPGEQSHLSGLALQKKETILTRLEEQLPEMEFDIVK